MKARETIYIGNRILAHDKSDFLRALDDLARQVTIDRLAELGENLTTETFRDVIRGGQAIRARMEDHMKNSIKALFFPAEKRKKQELFDILSEQLAVLCREAEYTLRFYRNIPMDAYIVREDGTVGYDETIIDRYFEEQKKSTFRIRSRSRFTVWRHKYGMQSKNCRNCFLNTDCTCRMLFNTIGFRKR